MKLKVLPAKRKEFAANAFSYSRTWRCHTAAPPCAFHFMFPPRNAVPSSFVRFPAAALPGNCLVFYFDPPSGRRAVERLQQGFGVQKGNRWVASQWWPASRVVMQRRRSVHSMLFESMAVYQDVLHNVKPERKEQSLGKRQKVESVEASPALSSGLSQCEWRVLGSPWLFLAAVPHCPLAMLLLCSAAITARGNQWPP